VGSREQGSTGESEGRPLRAAGAASGRYSHALATGSSSLPPTSPGSTDSRIPTSPRSAPATPQVPLPTPLPVRPPTQAPCTSAPDASCTHSSRPESSQKQTCLMPKVVKRTWLPAGLQRSPSTRPLHARGFQTDCGVRYVACEDFGVRIWGFRSGV